MKKLKLLFPFIITLGLAACSRPQPEQKPIPVMNTNHDDGIKIDIALLVSSKDPVCEMSLSDGIADTLSVDGKIYGFCSSGCKKEFLASLTGKSKS